MNIKLTRVVDEGVPDATGRIIPNVRIDFNVGPHGPFVIRIPKTEFSSAKANAMIQEFATHVAQLQGIGG